MKNLVKYFLVLPKSIYHFVSWKFVQWNVLDRYGVVVWHDHPKSSAVLDRIHKIKKEVHFVMKDNEAYQLLILVQATAKIPGDIAEVGSYQGGSSRLIGESKGSKKLHLFDTFEGIPMPTEKDSTSTKFYTGQYAFPFEKVKEYLRDIPEVYFYKGLFPSTSGPIKDRKFSFVHLDVDLYQATKEALEFFYPRMSKGGIILTHDLYETGVWRAFEEFFSNKPEVVIEISGYQGFIVKG